MRDAVCEAVCDAVCDDGRLPSAALRCVSAAARYFEGGLTEVGLLGHMHVRHGMGMDKDMACMWGPSREFERGERGDVSGARRRDAAGCVRVCLCAGVWSVRPVLEALNR